MIDTGDLLWDRVLPLLADFQRRVLLADPTLTSQIGHTANEVFPLRGYLSISRSTQGSEIAISVDLRDVDGQLTVTTDLCAEEGKILAEGPTFTWRASGEGQPERALPAEWLVAFAEFLSSVEVTTLAHASTLR